MATSFGALCTDFYINSRLSLKMDLPYDRETVLHLFDRVRAELPDMDRFKRFSDELALESARREGSYRWIALRQQSVRMGHVNPESMDEGFQLHQLVLELAPYFLTISPLDVESVELVFGFDLECQANHHQIITEALMQNTPFGRLAADADDRLLDLQPLMTVALDEKCRLQATYEVKGRTTTGQVRADRYRPEPISVFLTLRQMGPIRKMDELGQRLGSLREQAEQLATDKVVPELVNPISRAIIGSV
jgi:hypothetical protein